MSLPFLSETLKATHLSPASYSSRIRYRRETPGHRCDTETPPMTATTAPQASHRSIVELPSLRKRWRRRTLVVLTIAAIFAVGESTREFFFPAWTGWRSHLADAAVAASITAALILRLRNLGVFMTRGEINALLGAERALHESQAKLQLILNSTAEAIYGVDLHGRCTFCNPASLRLLGYQNPEDLLGKDMHDLIHHSRIDGTPYPLADCPIRRAFIRGEGTHCCDEVLWRADGSFFMAEYWSSPLRDGDRVVGAVVNFIDITQRIDLERRLLAAARTDKLTGLPNRTVLLEQLQAAIERHHRIPDSHYALLFLDFDGFKFVNDTLGHLAGDELLCEIARRLEAAVRTTDCITIAPRQTTTTRLGGDEFVILLDGLRSTADAAAAAERLLDALREPYTIANRRITSTASIGIITSDFGHLTAADALRDADTAMYEAKAAGKGRAALFNPSMRSRVQQQSQLEITTPATL